MPIVDPKAIREQLAVQDPADLRSNAFLRYVMRLSEVLDVDVPERDYPHLSTVAGSIAYVQQLPRR